jgi:hypothetical protein
VQALIVSPTRELASQTEKVILAIGDFINIQAHACIGGKSVGEDIRKLEHGVHVVSGTPGRVCDMIKRRTLRTRAIKLLVLVVHCFYLAMLDFFSFLFVVTGLSYVFTFHYRMNLMKCWAEGLKIKSMMCIDISHQIFRFSLPSCPRLCHCVWNGISAIWYRNIYIW